jgi:hypothetical protein
MASDWSEDAGVAPLEPEDEAPELVPELCLGGAHAASAPATPALKIALRLSSWCIGPPKRPRAELIPSTLA